MRVGGARFDVLESFAMPTTLVTGAAGALGTSLVSLLSQRGHRVVAVDLPRSQKRLASVDGAALHVAFDTLSADAWTAPLERIEREVGAVDGAVFVAGGWQGGGPLHDRKDDAIWRAMLDANLESVHRAFRALLPGMVSRGKGSCVVIGSRAAVRPDTSAGAAEYAATKSAVVALAQAVAAEVLANGVRINAILPGTIDTPANRASMPNADASRWVRPESLSAVIAFLLSDDARDVTGAAIPVYGRS